MNFSDRHEEALLITKKIKSIFEAKGKDAEIAVLVRASTQMRYFEEYFVDYQIPYQVIGGLKFYDRKEVKDTLSYLRVISNPHDDTALERIINIPRRGIGESTIRNLYANAMLSKTSLFDEINNALSELKLGKRINNALSTFIKQLNAWTMLFKNDHFSDALRSVMEDSGYLEMLREDDTEESSSRLDNVIELIKTMKEFGEVTTFLERVSLVNSADFSEQENAVKLMTLHAAKGLEFNTVFLPGWEEGTFPSHRAVEDRHNSGIEEERRLAYVGITRACKDLFISYTRYNHTYAQRSRFISELPKKSIQIIWDSNKELSRLFYGESQNSYTNPTSRNHYNPYKKPFNANSRKSYMETRPSILSNKKEQKKTCAKPGLMIVHSRFGKGIILSISKDTFEVAFSTCGLKTIPCHECKL